MRVGPARQVQHRPGLVRATEAARDLNAQHWLQVEDHDGWAMMVKVVAYRSGYPPSGLEGTEGRQL